MIYKSMFLCALLAPFSIFSNGNIESNNAIAQCIQELNNECSDKLLIISDLGKKIAEQDEYIMSIESTMMNSIAKVFKRKGLSPDEAKEFGKSLDARTINFNKALHEAIFLKKNVKGLFVKEFFINDSNEQIEDFERVKFYVIRVTNEYRILKALIEKYEELQQELLEIDQKLSDLKKQTSQN